MAFLFNILVALLILWNIPAQAEEDPLEELVHADTIDCVMNSAISSGLIYGGVVLVGSSKEDLFVRPFGRASGDAAASPVTSDTIFDVASLTKVFATAPSVMRLADDGRLDLLDPLTKWFPEFRGTGKDDLLVLHLLTHTSGLADFALPATRPLPGGVDAVASRELKHRPGSSFRYADINFILLGELVRRASGEEVDRYASTRFYGPLHMSDTAFRPNEELRWRCAATLNGGGCFLYGTVQDPNARLLGGVAGHAGLFSTAADLSRFCRMLLRAGELDGSRVLSESAVRQMVSPFSFQGGGIVRGIGWDMVSPYASPKGNGFSGSSFGHTGYSGCSVWVDPELDLYVILLTSRRDYRRVREFNRLRGSISTLAAEHFRPEKNRRQCREKAGKEVRQKT